MYGAGLRVSSTFYTPEYMKNGVTIHAKLTVYAFQNSGKKIANGAKKEAPPIQFTVWGKYAGICAKALSKGKEFHCNAKMNPYFKRAYYKSAGAGIAGAPVLNPDGSQVKTATIGFTVDDISFGADSKRIIAEELAVGFRPADWATTGAELWKQNINARMAIQFDPNSPTGTYGFALIRMPKGAGISAYAQTNATVVNVAQALGAVQAPIAQPAQIVTPAPVAQPAQVAQTGFVIPPVGV